MTIGSPRRFFSASRGRVIGRVSRTGAADIAVTPLRWLTPSGEEGRHLGVDVDDAVGVALHVHYPRLVGLHLGALVLPVGDDDDRVAAVHQARGGAVDLHVARAPPAGDRVALDAGAVVDVDDEEPLGPVAG